MTTRLAFLNIDGTHPLRRYIQTRDGDPIEAGYVLPGQMAELTVNAAEERREILEFDVSGEMQIPIQNALHASPPHTLRLKTSKRDPKKKTWDAPTHSEFIAPRGSTTAILHGPVRLEISELPL